MSTVKHIMTGSLRVAIYPLDRRTARVHVIGGGREAVFRLRCPDGPPELRESYGFPPRALGSIRTELIAIRESVCSEWDKTMAIGKKEWKAACERAAKRALKTPLALEAHYDASIDRIVVKLSRGKGVLIRPLDVQGLERAKPEDLAEIEISPSYLGLYFPRLDVDAYLPALLKKPLGARNWMERDSIAHDEPATTEAKAPAAPKAGAAAGRTRKKPKAPAST